MEPATARPSRGSAPVTRTSAHPMLLDLALTFRLSSVRQPLATIAGLLTRMVETPETPRQGVVVQPVLVARDSSSRALDGPVTSSSPGRSSATTVRPRR